MPNNLCNRVRWLHTLNLCRCRMVIRSTSPIDSTSAAHVPRRNQLRKCSVASSAGKISLTLFSSSGTSVYGTEITGETQATVTSTLSLLLLPTLCSFSALFSPGQLNVSSTPLRKDKEKVYSGSKSLIGSISLAISQELFST